MCLKVFFQKLEKDLKYVVKKHLHDSVSKRAKNLKSLQYMPYILYLTKLQQIINITKNKPISTF